MPISERSPQKITLATDLKNAFKTLGIVFGDIGTSPIYTLSIVFLRLEPNKENVLGVLSLILWTLVFIVSIQYALLAMNLSIRGEGGNFILTRILASLSKKKRSLRIINIVSFIGIAFLLGDSVITPSITIISAYEGLKLVSNITQEKIVLAAILTMLFLSIIQRRGTEMVSHMFSPIMFVWFSVLFTTGAYHIFQKPEVLLAINPLYALDFALRHGYSSLFVISEIFLCATGAEVLYADMGHLGRRSIRNAWFFIVFPAVTINYFGQGALITKSELKSGLLFFELIKQSLLSPLYIPYVILTTLASVIASQAVISGAFSVVYQAVNAHILPRLKVEHKSASLAGQVYIGFVNHTLTVLIISFMLIFKSSDKLGHAYGLTVNADMVLTAIFIAIIYFKRKNTRYGILSSLILSIDLIFLVSNSYKIKEGAYIPLILALMIASIMLIYNIGQEIVSKKLGAIDFHSFIGEYKKVYHEGPRIHGTAVFMVKDINRIPPYVIGIIKNQKIIYEKNILLSIAPTYKPYGINIVMSDIGPGLEFLFIELGYMEFLNMGKIFQEFKIDPTVIFYGIEEIITKNPAMKIYSLIKKLSPTFESFYNFPIKRLHGVITKVEI